MFKELIGNCYMTAVLGMCKNAGKTTVLNKLISEFKDETLALTSIGRDGETADAVHGTAKPRVFVPKGTVFASTKGLLGQLDLTYEVVGTTDISTPLGDVVILKAQSQGYAQISGASTTFQTLHLKDRFTLLGASRIFIDGAISRKSLGTTSLADGVILCSGASQSPKLHIAVAETIHAAELLSLPYAEPTPMSVFVKGAFTDSVLVKVLKESPKTDTIIIEDGTKALIAPQSLRLLEYRDIKLAVQRKISLFAITINPTSVTGQSYNIEDYVIAMANSTELPIIDVTGNKIYNVQH